MEVKTRPAHKKANCKEFTFVASLICFRSGTSRLLTSMPFQQQAINTYIYHYPTTHSHNPLQTSYKPKTSSLHNFLKHLMRPRITRVTQPIHTNRRAAATHTNLKLVGKKQVLPPIVERKKAETPQKSTLVWCVRKDRKTDDIRPIVISLAYPFLKLRSPLSLERCQSLNTCDDSEFSQLFRKKIQICRQLCDFSDDRVELEAKKIKLESLLDLLDFLKMHKDLGQPILRDILDMTAINLLRQIPAFPSLSSVFDEEPSIVDPTWEHLSVVYAILQTITLMITSIDQMIVKKLVKLMYIPHLPEREKLVDVLRNIVVKFELHRKVIYKRLMIHLSDYITSQKNPFSIYPTLNLLMFMNQYVPLEWNDCMGNVLPLMTMPHLRLFLNPFVSLLQNQMALYPDQRLSVLEYALRHCPRMSASKQRNFIFLLIGIAEKLNLEEFKPVAKKFASVFATFTLSPNVKVAETAMMIWSNDAVLNLVMECDRDILTTIFRALKRVSSDHWNKSVQNMALGAISIFEQRYPRVGSDAPSVPSSKYQMFAGAEKQHTTWVLIATTAAMGDFTFDLMANLNKINEQFNPNEETPMLSPLRRKGESDGSELSRFRSQPVFQEVRK